MLVTVEVAAGVRVLGVLVAEAVTVEVRVWVGVPVTEAVAVDVRV